MQFRKNGFVVFVKSLLFVVQTLQIPKYQMNLLIFQTYFNVSHKMFQDYNYFNASELISDNHIREIIIIVTIIAIEKAFSILTLPLFYINDTYLTELKYFPRKYIS